MIKDFLRRLRITYTIFNILNKKRLLHNVPLYKKYGLKKKYFSGISHLDFKKLQHPPISPNLKSLQRQEVYKELDKNAQKSIDLFDENGFVILPGFFSQEEVNKVNEQTEDYLSSGQLSFRYGNKKAVETHKKIPAVKELSNNEDLINILQGLLNCTDVTLIQSISFPRHGSEQRAHTDSFHLSTYPMGGMLGVWIALEEIDENNGPIIYYPGSHKLPYITNADYSNNGTLLTIGNNPYSRCEDMIEEMLNEKQLKGKVFAAKPGDVLIWHANLLHAGMPHLDKTRTRKSIVFHYYSKGCIWYHEISQRPVLQ